MSTFYRRWPRPRVRRSVEEPQKHNRVIRKITSIHRLCARGAAHTHTFYSEFSWVVQLKYKETQREVLIMEEMQPAVDVIIHIHNHSMKKKLLSGQRNIIKPCFCLDAGTLQITSFTCFLLGNKESGLFKRIHYMDITHYFFLSCIQMRRCGQTLCWWHQSAEIPLCGAISVMNFCCCWSRSLSPSGSASHRSRAVALASSAILCPPRENKAWQ